MAADDLREAAGRVNDYLTSVLLPSERQGHFDVGHDDDVPLWSDDLRALLDAHPTPSEPEATVVEEDEVGCGYCGESLTASYTGQAAYHLPCAARVYGDAFDVGGDR